MTKQKAPEADKPEAPEVSETEAPQGPVVTTNEEVEDLNATAQAASDPYASRKPEVEVTTRGNGVKVETYR